MRRTRIKICGITRLADAELASAAGVDALGFVFWPASPRAIDAETARIIVRALPPFVTPVGVFVNHPADEINAVVSRVGLAMVQLHGDEPVEHWGRISVPVTKALGLSDVGAVDAFADWPASVMPLLDVADSERRGGTGRTIDWRRAAAVAAHRRVMLAGGLRPDNVEEAVRTVRPYAVDISSGVERVPGVKDEALIRVLVAAVSRADASKES